MLTLIQLIWERLQSGQNILAIKVKLLTFNGDPATRRNNCLDYKRVAEVAREHGWHPSKSLDSDENFKPLTYAILSPIKICRDLRTFFLRYLGKKVPFWVKTVLLGQEVHYYMVYIAYFTELNSKI